MSFKITVDGFAEGDPIPKRFTCEGENTSPAVSWSGEPKGARSFALVVDDPDAPAGTWNHWLVWNIPPERHSLHASYKAGDGVRMGVNDFGKIGYGGPCPPKGHGPHRYYFSIYALDVDSLPLPDGANRAELDVLLGRHALGTAKCMGKYERHK